jgi:hypothetical protein
MLDRARPCGVNRAWWPEQCGSLELMRSIRLSWYRANSRLIVRDFGCVWFQERVLREKGKPEPSVHRGCRIEQFCAEREV